MAARLRAVVQSQGSSKVALVAWTVLAFAFLYLPLAVLGVFSFVSNTITALPLHHVTLHWYDQALHDSDVLTAVKNSVLVALGAVVIAVAIGVPGALLVDRHD